MLLFQNLRPSTYGNVSAVIVATLSVIFFGSFTIAGAGVAAGLRDGRRSERRRRSRR